MAGINKYPFFSLYKYMSKNDLAIAVNQGQSNILFRCGPNDPECYSFEKKKFPYPKFSLHIKIELSRFIENV